MNGAWFSWRIVFVSSDDVFEQAPFEEFLMPGELDLDLLLAAEASELEAIEAPPAQPQTPVRPDITSHLNKSDQLDDVTVRESELEETVGSEDESEPVPNAPAFEAVAACVASATVQPEELLHPDLRLDNFAPNRAVLKNRHIRPLLNLARRIVASIADQRSVQRVRTTGIFSASEPRSQVLAEDRARHVAAALREAIDRMWPGVVTRIEFSTAARIVDRTQNAQRRPSAERRAVEIFLESSAPRDPVAHPKAVRNADGRFAWLFEPSPGNGTSTSTQAAEKLVAPEFASEGYVFVLSPEAPPSRWICSLEIAMESDDAHLPHSEYAATFSATGLLVSPRHILTAAHCVFSRLSESSVRELESGDARLEDPVLRAKSIAVFPGRSGGALPFGSYVIRDPRCIRSSARWYVSRAANVDSDFALLTLDRPLAVGYWGKPPYHIVPLSDDQLKGAVAYTAGYPESNCRVNDTSQAAVPAPRTVTENTQWSTFGSIAGVSPNSFVHDLPFRSGQDGSPVWLQQGADRKLAGLMLGRNRALRLTAHTVKILRNWVAQDGCWSAT